MSRRRIAVASLATALLIGAVAASSGQTVSGTVYFDANGNGKRDSGENGLAGMRVTDSVNFVVTGQDGSYSIDVAEDTEIPYKPARVVSLSWSSGKWPSGSWWRRLDNIKDGEKVDFGLRDDVQKTPFLFVHVGDQHGGRGPHGGVRSLIREQLASMARFCVDTGDMGYATPESAVEMFSGIADGVKDFPVPIFFTPGNHDTVGRPPDRNNGPLFGVGAFTKYLGPVRWSFSYAGTHFVGVDWSDTKNGKTDESSEIAADWLDRDLKDLPPGTRVVLFMHFPSACARFEQVLGKYNVVHIFGGHNHVYRQYKLGGVTATTVINLKGLGLILGIVQENDFDVVPYCAGCKGANYHSKGCALRDFYGSIFPPTEQKQSLLPGLQARHGQHAGIVDKTVSSATEKLDAGDGPVHIVAEIRSGNAGKFGLKLGDSQVIEISHDGKMLNFAGTPIPFVPEGNKKALSWQIYVEKGVLTIHANNTIRLQKNVKVDNPSKVTAFAEGGSATFAKVDVWSLGDTKAGGSHKKAK